MARWGRFFRGRSRSAVRDGAAWVTVYVAGRAFGVPWGRVRQKDGYPRLGISGQRLLGGGWYAGWWRF